VRTTFASGAVVGLLIIGAGCGGGSGSAAEPSNTETPRSEERTYAGLTRAEARDAIEATVPEANDWIAENAGNAQVGDGAVIEPVPDFIPGTGGEEAWGAQIPLEGDIFGNPNPEICIWVWADPVDEGYFRHQYNVCG
jgi:hypothetical protein